MTKMTLKAQRDELLRAMKYLETALHNGKTADDDGYAVKMVRESEGDYLVMLTDLGEIARGAIEKVKG